MNDLPPPRSGHRLAFGPFVADLQSGQLWRDGESVAIQDLPFRMLTMLLERPGEAVSRSELAARLWGSETFVDAEAGINTAAAKLRQALHTGDSEPPLVETLPKRGYRFTGRVVAASQPAPTPAPANVDRTARASRVWNGLVLATAIVTAVVAFNWARANGAPVRVGVVLFDNETGRTEMDPFAQRLTDRVVAALAENGGLEVIGNATVLRTDRPFRDVEKIRQAINAKFVVIGQVQNPDQKLRLVVHLIRASDNAHVWIKMFPAAGRSDADIEAEISAAIAAAAAEHSRKTT